MNTKERIVATASKLFYEQGYNSTGVNQIIKEAEVAKATLYQYFPSKDDLLIEYLRVTALSTNEALLKVIAKKNTPKEKVYALFDFSVEFSKQTAFQGCNFLNVAAEIPKDNKKVKSLIKKQKDYVRSLFAEILKPIGKEDIADELYILFDGGIVASKIYGELWPIKTTRRIVEKLL